MEDSHRYDDIIDLPHHVSAKHPHMPLLDRAAQFSPFAALTGYGDAVEETARLTESWVELDESRIAELDERLQLLRDLFPQRLEVSVTWFLPDERKAGGSYQTTCGVVKKVDDFKRQVVMEDGTVIPIERIADLSGRLFDDI